jgi:membrane protease YdiL (CAAX protease family)
MAEWATFAGITGVVLVLLLVLSHLTQSAFAGDDADSADSDDRPDAEPGPDASAGVGPDAEPSRSDSARPPDPGADDGPIGPADPNRPRDGVVAVEDRPDAAARGVDPDALSTGAVLANVALSQGLFACLLVGAAVYAAIPASALGLEFSVEYLETGVVLGTVAGIGFYVANELAAAAATRLGFDHDEGLRELLAPESLGGWLLLLGGVLPIIAGFEELLFRAALIGVPAAGFGLSPWLLAVGSSVAFAVGHGMQGSVGVVVTGLLGFALAAVFVVTGSLLIVVVAHYLVNALEFVVHEGLDLEWTEPL